MEQVRSHPRSLTYYEYAKSHETGLGWVSLEIAVTNSDLKRKGISRGTSVRKPHSKCLPGRFKESSNGNGQERVSFRQNPCRWVCS